jgi:hypothetical protein
VLIFSKAFVPRLRVHHLLYRLFGGKFATSTDGVVDFSGNLPASLPPVSTTPAVPLMAKFAAGVADVTCG